MNRGLVHWAAGADRRIFYGNDHFLHCLDARTGRRVASFGEGGSIDLKRDLGRDVGALALQSTTPGVLFGDLLIMGMRLGEGPAPAAPGHIRAYDVRTGKLVWRFNTIPQPGEPGYETWPPNAHTYIGGVNVWTGFALDEKRGLVFCPTGSAAFDFWGGNRIGQGLYANCLVALDARTGRRVWHQQLVRHDLWDRDLPAPPNLLTLRRGGKKVDAVAQVTKSGHVFVFDRETGEPSSRCARWRRRCRISRANRPGRPSRCPPCPRRSPVSSSPPTRSPTSRPRRIARCSTASCGCGRTRSFLPPSREGTIIFPGFDGGAEWGGAAADPDGVLYVNANEMPWVLNMVETKRADGGPAVERRGDLHADLRRLPRRRPHRQQGAERPLSRRRRAAAEEGRRSGPAEDRQRRDAFVRFSQRTPARGGRRPSARGGPGGDASVGERPAGQGRARRGGCIGRHPVHHDRLPPLARHQRISCDQAALGHAQRDRPEHRRVSLARHARRVARAHGQGHRADRHRELRRPGGDPAGGLVFIAASRDEHLRAFDRKSGKELWKAKLPAAGYATPATYSVGGRQYVVIACGGGKIGTKSGDAYVAFRLPR